LSDSFLYW